MLLVDAHVHIHDCFEPGSFFNSTYRNFKLEAQRFGAGDDFIGILLLAETSRDHWFTMLSNSAVGKELPGSKKTGAWLIHRTDDECCLEATSGHGQKLYLIAGRQIATAEGLEVLALITTGYWDDGVSTGEAVNLILEKDALPVIPWGFGKWTGRRGRLLDAILLGQPKSRFFLGDTGGRAGFLGEPRAFRQAIEKGFRILPGSDPLPFHFEKSRAGSFGFMCKAAISSDHPARDLVRCLQNPEVDIEAYGKLETPLPFLFKQIAMQMKKRAGLAHSKKTHS